MNENLRIAEILKNANVYTDISGKWIQSQCVESLIKVIVQDCASRLADNNEKSKESIEKLLKQHFNLN